MKFTFPDGENFYVRKIPHANVIEIQIGTQRMCYERSESELKKISVETEERRLHVLEKIKQYFIPQQKHNRWKRQQ